MDVLEFTGSLEVRPRSGSTLLDQSLIFARLLSEKLLLKAKLSTRYDLTADGAQTVNLGGLAGAHVLLIESNSRVLVRLTSVEGTTQAVPVDGLCFLVCESEPFTAVDLTRPPGVETTVQVFLGEKL